MVISSDPEYIRKDLLEYFWKYCNLKLKKWKNTKKRPRSHIEAGKTCSFIPGIPLPDSKHDQKCLIRISLLNLKEIRPSRTFSQFYQTVTMETITITKIFNFSFHYAFQSSITVQSFIAIRWQEKSYQ